MTSLSLRGQLLIAGPTLLDPNFLRTVILLGEHSGDGAMGVILNRPSETPVAEAVPGLAEVAADEALLHIGGPVQPAAVTALVDFHNPEEAATIVFGTIGFAQGDADTSLLAAATRRARIFAGYAGWSPGQLDAEVEQGDWILASPQPDDVFSDEGFGLWASVLRRQGGRFALLARMPLDPSMN
ncbi:MAG: YqgE/AlgH family protein [Actinobacteria bacterium]|nr:YqgE/AlgH family protein [Actinomycetota bacterium]